MTVKRILLTATSASTWTAPADCTLIDRIDLWSAGSNGYTGGATAGAGGGGSGTYCFATNIAVTAGVTSFPYRCGVGNGTTGNGGTGASMFGDSSSCLNVPANLPCAQGAGANSGTTTSGGGAGSSTNAKPAGQFTLGGSGGASTGGGTGKGSGGGAAPAGPNGGNASGTTVSAGTSGGAGGAADGGTLAGGAGGTGAVAAVAGTAGSGFAITAGGTAGPGSGGGGASTTFTTGANGGTYGAGGGGGCNGGAGGLGQNGCIIITYTVADDTITPTDQPNFFVYQRIPATSAGTSASVVFAGAIAGTNVATVTSIEVQLTKESDGTVVQSWTALTSATIGSGAYSGTLSVPATAMMYKVQVRSRAGSTTIATSGISTNIFGVGDVIGMIGSSTMDNMRATISGNPAPSAYTYKYIAGVRSVNSGGGQLIIGNKLSSYNGGLPIMLLNGGDGGSLLTTASGWATSSSTPFTNFTTMVNACGGKLFACMSNVGSGDARTNIVVSQALQYAAYVNLIANTRTAFSQASLPFFIAGAQRAPLETADDMWTQQRAAEQQVCVDANFIYYVSTMVDVGLEGDAIHPSDIGYYTHGARLSRGVGLKLLGQSLNTLGPAMVSATYNSAGGYADCLFSISSGTGIVNGLNDGSYTVEPTCFQVKDSGGVAKTVSAATITNALTVRITIPTGLSTPITVGYMDGAHPGGPLLGIGPSPGPNCVFDNATPAYP